MDEKELRGLLDAEGAHAESAEADQRDRPLSPHVRVSRPNRARSRVLQVRLNPEEYDALERIAESRELPVSTIAREQLLRLILDADSGDRVRAWARVVAAAQQMQRAEQGLGEEFRRTLHKYLADDEHLATNILVDLGFTAVNDLEAMPTLSAEVKRGRTKSERSGRLRKGTSGKSD